MSINDSAREAEDPEFVQKVKGRGIDLWKVILFALLALILALILLGIFRFFAVNSYGGF